MHYFLLRGMWPSFSEEEKHVLRWEGIERGGTLKNLVINTKMHI